MTSFFGPSQSASEGWPPTLSLTTVVSEGDVKTQGVPLELQLLMGKRDNQAK